MLVRSAFSVVLAFSAQASICAVIHWSYLTCSGAWVSFVAYWIVGLPVGAALAFHAHIDIVGLWAGLQAGVFTALTTACVGMTVAVTSSAVAFLIIIWRVDFGLQVKKSAELRAFSPQAIAMSAYPAA